jgi:hypothetical protein
VLDLFGRTFRYEDRATNAIQEAGKKWAHIEEILASMEWGIMHDPQIGVLLNERGIRGFVFPGARSINEPDIDVLYEEDGFEIIIHDLTFRDAKAQYAGKA